jgi:hypothetical protein
VDLTFSAQPANGEQPLPPEPVDGPEVLDGALLTNFALDHRAFTLKATTTLVGSSERDKRLRFRSLQEDAPLLDLSSYRVDHEQGPVTLAVGHVAGGGQRHLINNFSSRGASLAVKASERVDLRVGANAGSQEVGWSNLLGVGDGDHRVLSADMGVEAFSRPGALRMEVGWMSGSLLPRSGFTRGAVTDAEVSDGLAFRVLAQGLDRRLRLDAGWSRSTFDNPTDPELTGGVAAVDVRATTNHARYLDLSLAALRGLSLGGGRTARLTVALKHERVDPLYRSVGATVGADKQTDQLDVNGVVAGVTLRGAFSEMEDNLAEIASVLKSKTNRRTLSADLPLPRLIGSAAWLPAVTYRHDRTHQFGVSLPGNGGFSAGHVPDQVSVNQSLSLAWQGRTVGFRYQLNHSDQDNRQEGRENADLRTLASGFGLSLEPARSLQLGLDVDLERSDNLGADQRDRTRRWGVTGTWRPIDRASFALRFSDSLQDDEAATREQLGRSLDLKWSARIPGAGRFDGTWFVRYNRSETSRRDLARDIDQDRTRWAVNVGASLNIARR